MDNYDDLRNYVNKYIFSESEFLNTLSADEKLIIELFCGNKNKKALSISNIASAFRISLVDVIKRIEDIIYKFHAYKLDIKKTPQQILKEKRLKEDFPGIDEKKIKEKLPELSLYQRRIFMMYYGINNKVYSVSEISDIENKVQGNINSSLTCARNKIKKLIFEENIKNNGKTIASKSEVLDKIDILTNEEKKVALMYFVDNMKLELIAKNTNHLPKTINRILDSITKKIYNCDNLEIGNVSRKKELARKFNTSEKDILDRVCYLDEKYRKIFISYYGINCDSLSTNQIKELYEVDRKTAACMLDISEKMMKSMLRKPLGKLDYESKNLGLIRLNRDYEGYNIRDIVLSSKKLDQESYKIFCLYYGIGCKAKDTIIIEYENNISSALIRNMIKKIKSELIKMTEKKYVDSDDINKKDTLKV